MMNQRNIALVCNPTPDNERAIGVTDIIVTLLINKRLQHTVYATYWPDHFDSFTEVWIIGGDGTLNHFINQFPNIQLPLAVFAGGTGNDFQWMLYGEMSVASQVDHVLKSNPVLVDAGVCNRKYFLNGVGIGFDGAIVRDLLGKKKLAGKASYLLSILKNIVGYQEVKFQIQYGEESFQQDCLMISIANAKRYGGGFHVAPKASVTDGLLDLNVVGKISPLKRIRYLPILEKGDHLHLTFVTYKQCPSVHIKASQPVPTHLDGEFMFTDVFDITLLPGRFSFLY
jgi:diacylglycerol kinase (ATP)